MSNYLLYGGGTNATVLKHQKFYNANKISYVCLTPFLVHGKRISKLIDYWSVIIDGEQEGVFKTSHVIHFFEMLNGVGGKLIAVHIHHWKQINFDKFQQIICTLNAPVYMFIHDYSTVCCNFTLLHENKFCGYGELTPAKCNGCTFYSKALEKKDEYIYIWNMLQERLHFIFPSEVAKKVWDSAYPQFHHLGTTISHQICDGVYDGNMGSMKEKLNIAYVGSREQYKGWGVFLKLYSLKKHDLRFRWFYLGTDEIETDGIKHIYVDNTKDSMAMLKALRTNQIDVAILWSLCKETYSYTYFECYASNVFVITSAGSGNIAYKVKENGNGLVIASEEELYGLFAQKLYAEVEIFKTGNIRGPETLLTNEKILNCGVHFNAGEKIVIKKRCGGILEQGLYVLEKFVLLLKKLRWYKNAKNKNNSKQF